MSAPHVWPQSDDPPYSCLICGTPRLPHTEKARCEKATRHPQVLRERIARLAEEANALALDLIAARDAAEPGEKATWRYPLRHVEHAAALLGRAAK